MTKLPEDDSGSFKSRFPKMDPELAAALRPLKKEQCSSIDEARARVAAGHSSAIRGPRVGSVSDSVIEGVPVRIYRGDSASRTNATVIHFHGGGWVTGDLEYGDAWCRLIAATTEASVINVDYRLAPERRFPAAYDDARKVVVTVLRANPERLVLVGDSAGANLVAAVTANLPSVAQNNIDAQVLIYPLIDDDLEMSSVDSFDGVVLSRAKLNWYMDQYCPESSLRNDSRFAPSKSVNLDNSPRTLIAVAGHDPLRNSGVAFGHQLAELGVHVRILELPTLVHGFLRQTRVSSNAANATGILARAVANLDWTEIGQREESAVAKVVFPPK